MKKMFVYATVASLILASCSKNDESTEFSRLPNELGITVKNIKSNSLTKSEVTDFTDKSVSIFIQGVNTNHYTPKQASYTLTAGNWVSPTAVADKIFLTGEDANVYGLYPADATFDLSTKTMTCAVAKDQDFSATAATDYMYSTGAANDLPPAYTNVVVSTKTANSNLAQLYFHHALCNVCFVVNKAQSYPTNTNVGVLTKITMESSSSKFSTAGTLNVATGAYTSTSTATTLTLTGTANSTEFANIVADPKTATPQAYGLFAPLADLSNITIKFTIDGVDLATTLATNTVSSWLPGNRYVYTVTITANELNITCQIVPWVVTVQDLGTIN